MPGAGTLVATNHLYNVAPKDGTAIGMVSRSMPAAAVMKVANVRFDPVQFNWIGSPEVNHLVLYINNATPIKTPADLFTHELIVGATGLAQGITVGPFMLKNLLGMKVKIVTGYESPGDMALAASRREVDAFANTIGGGAGSARRPWVELGQMRVLFNFEPEPVPGLGVPTVFEFAKTDEQRKVLTFFASNVLLGRPIMAPPGVPKDRVALLRRAFEAVMKDPALLKEAESMSLEFSLQTGDGSRSWWRGSRRPRPRPSSRRSGWPGRNRAAIAGRWQSPCSQVKQNLKSSGNLQKKSKSAEAWLQNFRPVCRYQRQPTLLRDDSHQRQMKRKDAAMATIGNSLQGRHFGLRREAMTPFAIALFIVIAGNIWVALTLIAVHGAQPADASPGVAVDMTSTAGRRAARQRTSSRPWAAGFRTPAISGRRSCLASWSSNSRSKAAAHRLSVRFRAALPLASDGGGRV